MLILRSILPVDLPILYAQQTDPATHALIGTTARTWDEYTAHMSRTLADKTAILRVIEWEGEVAGAIACFSREGLREIGCRLGEAYWNRGLATQALAALLAEVPERPLYARVSRQHAASYRVLEKMGFVVVEDSTFTNALGEEVEELLLRRDAA